MAFKSQEIGPVPSLLYTKSGGVWRESVETTWSLHRKVVTGQHTDTVRRIKPKDLFASGTGWTFKSTERNCLGVGYQEISASQYRVALPNRWWVGSSNFMRTSHGIDLAAILRSKIKDQNLNLALSLAEYRKTADLFSSAAKDVYAAFRSLRSGRGMKDIARYLKTPNDDKQRDVANRWLQYQYGVKPTISDVYGSVEELNKKLYEGVFLYVNFTRKSSESGQAFWPNPSSPVGSSSWSVRHNVRVKARYKISGGGVKQLSQVGITNPALLVWELIPYSFVVDWLIPVGDWLSSLDALAGVSDLRYYTIQNSLGHETGATYGGGFSHEQVFYTRNGPYTNVSLPRLRYKPSDSLTKVLNGLALLRKLR